MTLDEDVLARVQDQSRLRGEPFRKTLNELLREALLHVSTTPTRRTLRIQPTAMGPRPGLNYDDIEGLLESAEGERHR